jgi:uncharacterized membrane protein
MTEPNNKDTGSKDPGTKTNSGIEPNLAGLLCYAVWWITGIIFLLIEKENKFIRFHAIQSIFTFGAISIIQIILGFIPVVGWILGVIVWVAAFILWILLMYQAYQGKMFKLPIVGDIAEKQSGPTTPK